MFTNSQGDVLQIELKKCKTVKEMFTLLDSKFQLDKASPGDIAKPLFIKGIIKGIKLVDPPLKK